MIDPMFEPEFETSLFVNGSRAYGRPLETQRIVEIRMAAVMKDPTIKCVMVGGAMGIDDLCLKTLRAFREKLGADGPYLIVVCPCTEDELPETSKPTVQRCADRIVELGRRITAEDSFEAYHARNRYGIDNCRRYLSFWNGQDERSGTRSTFRYAESLRKMPREGHLRRENEEILIPAPKPKNQRIPVPANKRR